MRIPIAKGGYSIIFAATLLMVVVGGLTAHVSSLIWVLLAIVWGWVVSFFRDPAREITRRPNVLYAPADGRITEVSELDHHHLLGGPGHRIRIFLSLFNAHVNRMPCAASVRSIDFKPGKFINAMRDKSAEQNESNTLIIAPQAPIAGPIVVRQIAGMIARTIVCHAQCGTAYASGQRFGMIKFGSGTELVVPRQKGLTVLVKVGDNVKAGLTELIAVDTIQS